MELSSSSRAERIRTACFRCKTFEAGASGYASIVMLFSSTRQWLLVGCVLFSASSLCTAAHARQEHVIPAVADSPTAQALVEQARAQASSNAAEAARLARRLLDEFGDRIVSTGNPDDGNFISVGLDVESLLLQSPDVLARFLRSESDEAARMLAERGPAVTVARRLLTPAGLSASLILAEDALRRGQFDAAVVALDRAAQHPLLVVPIDGNVQLVRQRAAYLALLSMSLRARGDDERLRDVLQSLKDLATNPAAADALAAATRFVPPPRGAIVLSAMTGGAQGALPNDAWRKIFSKPLEESIFLRFYGPEALARLPERAVERARADASWLTGESTVSGGNIFVSEGRTLRAFDATTAQELWSVDLALRGTGRETGVAIDLLSVAVQGFDAAVIAGNGFSNARTDGGRVFLVDVRGGVQRWSVSVDGLEGRTELDGAFAVGTPVIIGDSVLITVRRPTTRLEQADSVLALSRKDGSIQWLTLIAASGGTRAVSMRRAPGMCLDHGALFVSTPLGAIARVRIEDGAIQWLRRFRVPLREPRFSAEAWECARPAIVMGRLLSVTPDEAEIVSLDVRDGATIGVAVIGPGTVWGSPRSLLASDAMLLAIGGDVVAFDPTNLTTPIWTLSETEATAWGTRGGRDNRGGIRGRVSIAGEIVLVPSVDDLWFVRLSNGKRIARLETKEPVNAVLTEDRVVTVGVDQLSVYMSGLDAVAALRARLDGARDPSAAIALFDLARDTGDLALALDAAQRACSILSTRAGDPLRRVVGDRLVESAPNAGELGERYLALATEIADDDQLRARLAFARAEWFSRRGNDDAAVEAWRAIAAADIGEVAFVEDGAVRATRSVAVRALAKFLREPAHAAAQSAYEARADAALQALTTDLTADACVRFVESYPRTAASARAAQRGSEILIAATRTREASAIVAIALREARIAPARSDLLALLRADASFVDGRSLLPRLGDPTFEATEFPGRLVRRAFDALAPRARNSVYVMEEFDLVARDILDFKEQWRLPMMDRDPVLLTDGALLIFSESAKDRPEHCVAINATSGAVLWRTAPPDEVFGPLPRIDGEPGGVRTLPEGTPYFAGQLLASIAGDRLAIVRRNGDAATFDPRVGSPTVIHGVMSQVYVTASDEQFLAVGGRRIEGDATRPVVALFDPATLALQATFATASGGDVRWISRSKRGEVAVGTTSGIEIWSLAPTTNGLSPRFMTGVADARSWDSVSPVWCEDRLFALDRNGRLLSVGLWTGGLLEIGFGDGSADLARTVRALSPFGTDLLAHSDNRVALINASGAVIGRDSSVGDLNFISAVLGQDRIVLVNGVGGRQAPNAMRTALISEYIYRLSVVDPTAGLRLLGESVEVRSVNQRFNRTIGVDGWILLSNDTTTVAVRFEKSSKPSPIEG